MRRILQLSGWQFRLGLPRPEDTVAVWGKSPTSFRGEAMAAGRGAHLLRVEDAFLRSVLPGRSGEAGMGLLLDDQGIHFDSSAPSRLEDMLANAPMDDYALLSRARDAMDQMRWLHLSKYNDFDPAAALPRAPYVLVLDQTRGDASIEHAGASVQTFREMLVMAQEEHPGLRVLIKTHPETAGGHRLGHYGPEHAVGKVELFDAPVSPYALMEGAVAVYTVSSGMGFEAILAGHKPRVFGQPWYAGWGLTADENPVPRRERILTRAQLFSAAMITYPTWYDVVRDELCEIETVIENLAAQARAHREDGAGYVAAGMRLWKRAPLKGFFGHGVRFAEGEKAQDKAEKRAAPVMVWAGKEAALPAPREGETRLRIEDGFLRSRGLGAELVPPLSLVRDDLGIYYDPTRESRLERLITAATRLPPGCERRAERLVERLNAGGLSKYNLAREMPDLPAREAGQKRILVPGQVEDDASIRLGCDQVATNRGLLRGVRAANPEAQVIFKPHPDVEAGLRLGGIDAEEAAEVADLVAQNADPVGLMMAADEVWTLTSTLGFEALLRGKTVTCLGAPFYAGWGLTRDLGTVPERRQARPTLAQLTHAVLIDYPRYHDPVSGRPCSVEVVLERLESGDGQSARPTLRALSKLQGLFASATWLWRR